MSEGRYYYLGKDGKEYFIADDAHKYGGGVVGRRYHNPIKKYEEYKYDPAPDEAANAPVIAPNDVPMTTSVGQASLALTEFDHMEVPQLKEILRSKGYTIKGNPGKDKLLEQIKKI